MMVRVPVPGASAERGMMAKMVLPWVVAPTELVLGSASGTDVHDPEIVPALLSRASTWQL
jgi:hypothetical protein